VIWIYFRYDKGGSLKKLRFIRKNYIVYLMFMPALALIIVFCYVPMYGVILSFKNYRFLDGIWGSPWVGLKHFERMFSGPFFLPVLKNTIEISLLHIVFGFPAPIVFALMINELVFIKFKKAVQTISYLPYFISWVALGGIIVNLLSPSRGVVNNIIGFFGIEPVYFLTEARYFVPMLIITAIWKNAGWGSIVYLAAIAGVEAEQYESARLDGANRWRQIWHITLPSILPVISIMFIMGLGGILNAGFDQIFNLYNPMVYKVADILDTYVYREGIMQANYAYSTAVGLFKNFVGFFLVFGTNLVVRRIREGEYAIW